MANGTLEGKRRFVKKTIGCGKGNWTFPVGSHLEKYR